MADDINTLQQSIADMQAKLIKLKAEAKPKAEARVKEIVSKIHALLHEAEALGKEHRIEFRISFETSKQSYYDPGKVVDFNGWMFEGVGDLAPKTEEYGWSSSSSDC